MRQIGGIRRIAEAAPQPSQQPAVMIAVKSVQVLLHGEIGGGHRTDPDAGGTPISIWIGMVIVYN
ncbi:hypothetical protein WJ969_25020 [Achromobacter xylosoxidans]